MSPLTRLYIYILEAIDHGHYTTFSLTQTVYFTVAFAVHPY